VQQAGKPQQHGSKACLQQACGSGAGHQSSAAHLYLAARDGVLELQHHVCGQAQRRRQAQQVQLLQP
jgi:hypothetical protein